MKITINNLQKSFSGKAIIKNLSFEIASNHITTLLGPSGCGKTTLLRTIAGLETADSGEIWFDHTCVFSSQKRINISPEKRELGFVFQDFALWPHLTVFENVAFGLRAKKHTTQLAQKVQETLAIVQLEQYANHYPSQLSGGQQQRVAFSRAIITRPRCILFDEPLSALDAILREDMRIELVEMVNSLGITAIFVTHDQLEAMSMSQQVIVLNAGNIEQQDTPEIVYQNPRSPFVGKFIGRSNWIDDITMFRPEKIYFTPQPGALTFSPKVVSSHFQGDWYELRLEHQGRRWTALSPQNMLPNSHINIYVSQDDILRFAN